MDTHGCALSVHMFICGFNQEPSSSVPAFIHSN
jgi:hypothetical protein